MDSPMPSLRVRSNFAARPRRHAQRGVIMILVLVALVLLLVAVAGMLRYTDSTTSVVGNLAFRRDLTNRAELAIATAKGALNNQLFNDTTRTVDNPTYNYSSSRLPSPTVSSGIPIGVPALLVSNSAYTAKGYACMPTGCTPGTDGVVVRWIIERECSATGTFSTASCGFVSYTRDANGTAQSSTHKPTGAAHGLFRISVRVTGPRNTEVYIQTNAG